MKPAPNRPLEIEPIVRPRLVGDPRAQYGALPWRRGEGLEILLVSSRDTRRWVLPKGWPMKGRKPHAAAAREALEEAGVEGRIAKAPIGAYHYLKRMKNGSALPCEVTVFPFEVLRERKNWRERAQRVRRWFAVLDAAEAVDEPDLRAMILAFGEGSAPSKTARKRSAG